MFRNILNVLILLSILLEVQSTNQSQSSHQKFCNETIPCNQSSLLTCQDSRCECILTDSMSFSEDKGRCVSLADEACGQMSMDTSEVLLQCVPNAFCNSQGYCHCTQGYFKDDEGHCKAQNDFGDSCHSDLECLDDLGLVCVNETCSCNRTVSIDSLKFGDTFPDHRCLGRAGLPCLNGHCVPNSSCKTNRDATKGHKTCQCLSGFEETTRGLCLATFNKTCDTQSHINCLKGLSCVNGLCQCKYPRDQIYDKSSGSCLALVGGPCNPPFDTDDATGSSTGHRMSCISNAFCKNIGDSYAQCECEDGFVENRERKCDIAYGNPCSSSSKVDEESAQCDQLAQLTCRDGKCLCIDDGQVFDKDLWKCRGLVGSVCDVKDAKGGEKRDDYCVKHAECQGRRNGRLSHGQCQCREEFEETEARTCSCLYCNEDD